MKGHAFLVLESHRFAKEVVDAIDGQKLQGWELRAMPTKEGFEPAENFYSEQRGYLMPDSSGRKSKSGMQHLSDYVSHNEFQLYNEFRKSVMEYRDVGWNGEGFFKIRE